MFIVLDRFFPRAWVKSLDISREVVILIISITIKLSISTLLLIYRVSFVTGTPLCGGALPFFAIDHSRGGAAVPAMFVQQGLCCNVSSRGKGAEQTPASSGQLLHFPHENCTDKS